VAEVKRAQARTLGPSEPAGRCSSATPARLTDWRAWSTGMLPPPPQMTRAPTSNSLAPGLDQPVGVEDDGLPQVQDQLVVGAHAGGVGAEQSFGRAVKCVEAAAGMQQQRREVASRGPAQGAQAGAGLLGRLLDAGDQGGGQATDVQAGEDTVHSGEDPPPRRSRVAVGYPSSRAGTGATAAPAPIVLHLAGDTLEFARLTA
jgi:hypothetical protein